MDSYAKSAYKRWMEKASSYNMENQTTLDNNIENYFDKYFSLFVAFNILYNENAKKLFSQGRIVKDKLGRFSDKQSATKYIIKSINKSTLINRLCNNSINEIFDLIPSYFTITEKDESLKKKWKDRKDIMSILEILYGIRCNMFHGSKDFEENQVKLLIPAIKILEKLNTILFDVLS